jgi:hypothetical protein
MCPFLLLGTEGPPIIMSPMPSRFSHHEQASEVGQARKHCGASCLLSMFCATGVVWQGAWISSGDHQAHCKQGACGGQKSAEDSLGSTAMFPEQQPALGRCCYLTRCQAQGQLQCHAISCMLCGSILALVADIFNSTMVVHAGPVLACVHAACEQHTS